MLAKPQPTRIHLPKGWQDDVKSAVLHAIALAHYAIVYARAWAADSINARARLAAENDRLGEDCLLLREELRIKDSRMTQIAPQRRPHYGPHERMAILELRAARGWSVKQTADTFLVTPATIALWVKRIDDQGANALLHLRCEDAGSQRHRPVTCRASTRVNFRWTTTPTGIASGHMLPSQSARAPLGTASTVCCNPQIGQACSVWKAPSVIGPAGVGNRVPFALVCRCAWKSPFSRVRRWRYPDGGGRPDVGIGWPP